MGSCPSSPTPRSTTVGELTSCAKFHKITGQKISATLGLSPLHRGMSDHLESRSPTCYHTRLNLVALGQTILVVAKGSSEFWGRCTRLLRRGCSDPLKTRTSLPTRVTAENLVVLGETFGAQLYEDHPEMFDLSRPAYGPISYRF